MMLGSQQNYSHPTYIYTNTAHELNRKHNTEEKGTLIVCFLLKKLKWCVSKNFNNEGYIFFPPQAMVHHLPKPCSHIARTKQRE